MKKWIVLSLLAALVGCGKESDQGAPKKVYQVKAAAKDATTAELEKKNAELEARLKMMEDVVTEVKNKQSQVDDMLAIQELAEKARKKNTSNK